MYLRRDPSQRLQDHNFHIASKGLKQGGGLPNFLNLKFGWFLGMLAHLGVSNSPYPKSLPRSCNKAIHAWKCGEKRLFRNTTRCSEVLRAEPKITAGIVDDLETNSFLPGQDVDLWLIPFPYEKNTWETHGLVMHSWNIMKLGIPCEAKCWTHHWGPYQWMIPNSTSLPSPSVLQRLSGVKHEHQYGKGLSNWDPLCGSGHRSIVWCFDLQMALSETWNSGTPRKKPPKNWWLNISVGYTFQDFTINPRRILLEYITIIFRQILISGDIFQ